MTPSSSPDARDVARVAAATPDYRQGPVPPEVVARLPQHFSAEVFVPAKPTQILLAQAGAPQAPQGLSDLLDASWQAAREEGALRYYEEKVVFPVALLLANGAPVEVSVREGDPERSRGRAWHVCYVNTYAGPRASAQPTPGKALEQWAWLGRWEDFLQELARVALPETWEFGGSGHRPYQILKSYIATTFYRLQSEGKVCVNAEHTFAAFNTGLVDNRYDDVYACFEPDPTGRLAWRFCGLAGAGNRALKKQVARYFNPLPQPARYVDRLEDLLFDLDRTLVVDYDHILLDNMERLPLSFFAYELSASSEATALVKQVQQTAPGARGPLFAELAGLVDDEPRLFRSLRNRLEDAVEVARRRVRWNFKTAIPCYYPRANAMSLLLPLCLTDDEHADAALVVQLLESGNYQGQTILTMEQAYMDARLICRPDSDWLTPEQA